MPSAAPPPSREVELVLRNRHGLHVRPATVFAREATRFRSEVQVSGNGREANGKSILMLIQLALESGDRLVIRADGEDAEDCIASLEALIEDRFGEEPAPEGNTSAGGN
jgi:phosphocarrier protein